MWWGTLGRSHPTFDPNAPLSMAAWKQTRIPLVRGSVLKLGLVVQATARCWVKSNPKSELE